MLVKQKKYHKFSIFTALPFLVLIFFVLEIFLSLFIQPLDKKIGEPAQAVSVSKGDGLLLYGSTGNINPQSRFLTNSGSSFSSPSGTVSGSVPQNMVVRTSPKKQEAIAGYVNSSGSLQIMCFNGNTWSNEFSVTVGGTGTTRRFDIAYETNTGDVMVVYSTNTATTNELGYRTRPGSLSCGAANWAVAANIDPVRTSGIVHWVKMVPDRRSSENNIALAIADANSDLTAGFWSGNIWMNEPSGALATSLDVVSAAQDVENFDIEYESVSGDLMVVWGISVGDNTNGVRYATCTGGTTSCSWSSVLTPPTFSDDAIHLDISSHPTTNEIVFASVGKDKSDLQLGYWSGTSWTNENNSDTSSESVLAGRQNVSTGWLISGSTSRSVIVYQDNNEDNIGWYVGNGGSFSKQSDFNVNPDFAEPQYSYRIEVDPINTDRLALVVSDSSNDVFVKRLAMDSTPAFTWTNIDGGVALETNVSNRAPCSCYLAYWRYAPTFEQSAYRWFENNNSSNVGVASVNPSAGDEFVRDFAVDSQYIYAVGHDASSGNNQWRIEKRKVGSYDYDLTFGTSGVMANNPSVGDDRAQEIIIDNEFMYIGGYDQNLGNARWRIEKRYKTTGFTDFSFGTIGVVNSNPSSGNDFVRAIAQDNNYIYVAGVDASSSDNRWMIEKRQKSNGSLVGAFGASGVVSSNPSLSDDQLLSISVYDGYIYTAGYDSVPGNKQIRIEKRSTISGALEDSFGVSGVITANIDTGDDVINKIKIFGGIIYTAGYDSGVSAADLRWRIEKRNISDGSYIGAFGISGVVSSNPSSGIDELYDFDVDGTDIFLGGSQSISVADYQWRVEKRSSTTGSLDGSFGSSGVVTVDPGSGLDRIRAINVLSTSVLMAGAGTVSSDLGWRFEKRSSTTGDLAKVLAAQNTSASLSIANETFRLRSLLTISGNTFFGDQDFKLQFSQKSGTCDTAFSGESYYDVTSSSAIAYYNNASVIDGSLAAINIQDPTNGNAVNYQTYEESNNFTANQSNIAAGQDGLWDFSLWDKSAPVGTSYCFRIVKSDGSLLDTYSVIPEITTVAGSLNVGIVDTVGSAVDSPAVLFSDSTSASTYQVTSGTLGINSQRIRMSNSTANPQWQISISASDGSSSLWLGDDGGSFDFNDPTPNAGDGADTDPLGGRMTINPSVGTVSPKAGCANTGLSLGSSSSFSEGSIDSILLVSAGVSAATGCYWDLTGVSLSQTVPIFQSSDDYSRPMTITITAL